MITLLSCDYLKINTYMAIMKSMVIKIIYTLLGNRFTYKLGRSLYMYARHESGGIMEEDGEYRIQRDFSKRLPLEEDNVVVFDIGANLGKWTISLLDMIPIQKVSDVEIHGFEPINETYKALKNNIESNPRGNQVKLVRKACSNTTGVDQMFIATTNSGENSFHPGEVHSGSSSVSIEKITLDKYCTDNNISLIHFIKSDTEGHELEVIRGAQRLFTEEKIMVFQFEYNQTWFYSRFFMKDVFDLLAGMPYLLGKITPQGLYIYRKWHPEIERFFESNYLIVHKNALPWFNHKIGSFDESYYFKVENSI
jgi:FkbM family methyltransferase